MSYLHTFIDFCKYNKLPSILSYVPLRHPSSPRLTVIHHPYHLSFFYNIYHLRTAIIDTIHHCQLRSSPSSFPSYPIPRGSSLRLCIRLRGSIWLTVCPFFSLFPAASGETQPGRSGSFGPRPAAVIIDLRHPLLD